MKLHYYNQKYGLDIFRYGLHILQLHRKWAYEADIGLLKDF